VDIKNIKNYNKYTTLSIMLLYDLTFDEQKFNNVKILINELLKLIYSNIIMIISHSKNKINKNEENTSILYHIINNIQNKYTHNNNLYLDDSEYLLIDQNSNFSYEEKINYNMNFIIRNIHTIINNMKNAINYDNFLDLFKKINDVSFEDMNNFYRHKILKINFLNSSFLSSEIIKNNLQYYENLKLPPYITTSNEKKFTLVISLDETLIHFKKGNIKTNQGIIQLRPGILEFFEAVKPYYEIVLFCNGNKKYSDLVINSVEKNRKYIDQRLYREQSIVVNNDFVKDISKIGRPIDKTIIVDNLPQNFRLNKENGINIKSFYGDNPNDKILFNLSKILVNIGKTNGDVREEIKKIGLK
jgi:Dullard-like phosphatase family protein